jgi:hypothetical protein
LILTHHIFVCIYSEIWPSANLWVCLLPIIFECDWNKILLVCHLCRGSKRMNIATVDMARDIATVLTFKWRGKLSPRCRCTIKQLC